MLLPKHQATSCRLMQRKLHSGISCNLCTPTFCLPGWRICWKLFTYWLLSSRRSWYLCLKLRLLDTSYDKALFFTCFSLCQKWFRLKFVGNILFFFCAREIAITTVRLALTRWEQTPPLALQLKRVGPWPAKLMNFCRFVQSPSTPLTLHHSLFRYLLPDRTNSIQTYPVSPH